MLACKSHCNAEGDTYVTANCKFRTWTQGVKSFSGLSTPASGGSSNESGRVGRPMKVAICTGRQTLPEESTGLS